MEALRNIRRLLTAASLSALAVLNAGCQPNDSAASTPGETKARPAPRFADGTIRFDRAPGEQGFWDSPAVPSLYEAGAKVEFDASGKLRNPADAAKVAPFQPWALELFKYRQGNNLADD